MFKRLILLANRIGGAELSRASSLQNLPKKIDPIDYRKFLTTLLEGGMRFEHANNFVSSVHSGSGASTVFIKHDVHHDLKSCLVVGDIEKSIGVRSTFFFLGDHQLTKRYNNTKEYWQAVEQLLSQGHEIGVHVDAHDLLEKHGCLIRGIQSIVDLFKNNVGFQISAGNFHGNTTLRKLYGSPKAMVKARASDVHPLTHRFRMIGDKYRNFYAYYSLEQISTATGIHCWFDSECYHRGELLPVKGYITDNSGEVRGTNSSGKIWSSNFQPFNHNDTKNLIESIRIEPYQMLIHPQNIG